MLLVHLIDGVVLDREEHESLGILGQDGFFLLAGGEERTHAILN